MSRQPAEGCFRRGEVIGDKYQVVGTLGQGGFGVVYLVRIRHTNHVRAVKTIRSHLLASASDKNAFQQEARRWIELGSHPFIVAAEWVEETSGRLFVEMDFVPPDSRGRVSVQDYLGFGPLATDRVLRWAIQFCFGMQHAQSRGILCHRDIKPGNLLVGLDGTLKISDFGLAVAAEKVISPSKADQDVLAQNSSCAFSSFVLPQQQRVVAGTPGYIAPEVYRGEGADIYSDVYSFGLVLWQMVAGSTVPPYYVSDAVNMQDFMEGVYRKQMQEKAPAIAGPLQPIVQRCLEPYPAQRFAGFGEICEQLRAVFRNVTGEDVTVPEIGEHTERYWINRGGSLLAVGEPEEAIACFDRALEIGPQSPDAWGNRAAGLVKLGRYQEAVDCCAKALDVDPRCDLAWNNMGIALTNLGRVEEALACYEKVLEIDARHLRAWCNKGEALSKLGRHNDAIECYAKALQDDPRFTLAWNNRGVALGNLGRLQDAVVCYDTVLGYDPHNAMAWSNKGNALGKWRRHKEAFVCHTNAVESDPEFALAWHNRAICLVQLDRIGEAIDSFDRALKIDPHNSDNWLLMGVALSESNRREEAIACYTKALEIHPSNLDIWRRKADLLASSHRMEESLACYESMTKIDPTSAEVWTRMAATLGHLDRHDRALACVDKAMELNPESADAWALKGLILNSAGRHLEAVACCDRALEICPRMAFAQQCKRDAERQKHAKGEIEACESILANAASDLEGWLSHAEALRLLGRHREAVSCCDKALAVDSRSVPAWCKKATILCDMGHYDDAVACCDKAMEVEPRDANLWNIKGNALRNLGQHEEAVSCYDRTQEIDPAFKAAWTNKGASLGHLGRYEAAMSCFRKALDADPNNAIAWFNKALVEEALSLPHDAAESYRNFIKLAAPGHEKHIEYASQKLLIENVIQAVCDTMSVDRNRVNLNTAVKADLGADALLFCEVLAHLQEKLRFRFAGDQVERMRTVGDIVESIRTQLSRGRIV